MWTNSNTSLAYKQSIGFETKDTVTVTEDQWAGISSGHYEHYPRLLWEETKEIKNIENFLAAKFIISTNNFIYLATWNLSDSPVLLVLISQ